MRISGIWSLGGRYALHESVAQALEVRGAQQAGHGVGVVFRALPEVLEQITARLVARDVDQLGVGGQIRCHAGLQRCSQPNAMTAAAWAPL